MGAIPGYDDNHPDATVQHLDFNRSTQRLSPRLDFQDRHPATAAIDSGGLYHAQLDRRRQFTVD